HHTVVVESISKNQVILLDPEEGRIQIEEENFEFAWSAAGNLAIIIQTKKGE
ncbi:MAG: cysteine peptidase family C39 domain-containing protein, partial [bacterium]